MEKMKIANYEVPTRLIVRYCELITMLEKDYSAHVEKARGEVHNEIFDQVGCCRDLHRQEDREFNTALNKAIEDLMYVDSVAVCGANITTPMRRMMG